MSSGSRWRRSWWLAPLCLVAFLQALAYYAYLRDDPGSYNGAGAFGDQVEYLDLGQQLLRGEWLGRGHYMPGYPALLAVCQVVFGDARLGVALVQATLFVALVVGAAALAGRVFGPGARPWAAALVALNPSLGYYAGQTLTEFVTGVLLTAIAAVCVGYQRAPGPGRVGLLALLTAALVYVRSEYLGLVPLFGLLALILARGTLPLARGLAHGVALGGLVALLLAPWVARNAVATGEPSLHEASPVSNLLLMGTWFRVFDEPTFMELQRIQRARITDEEAVRQAASVGPRPDLSARYMEQARGPYERPLGEALREAAINVQMNPRQYLVNHFVLAPVLIWAGHTPVRQADVAAVPASARWLLWGAQLALVLVALGTAARGLRAPRSRALSLVFLLLAGFISAIHLIIAVDDRFTIPALPLVQLFAGAGLAAMIARIRQRTTVSMAAPRVAEPAASRR